MPTELGPFREIEEIDSGGFGVVCRAVDSRDGQQVALKFPREKYLENDEMLNQFLEEAHRAQGLDHPGIVKTFAVEQIAGYLVIVQQLIEGTDLKKSLDQFQNGNEVANLVANIADALAYANREGIVHRDLKPANILLDNKGRPYIADFGLAIHETAQLDMPRQRCGTPPYMSPQLVAGLTRNLDGRSDIWSLGVILYELLTGRRPFRGSTAEVIFEQIETRDPKPLRQIDHTIDKELERICLKCLARPTRERFLTADDLAEDLRYWIKQQEDSSIPLAAEDATSTFVPKGLRSYGAEDSKFFLDLLPGPTDRDGTPASMRFWSVRIKEPVAEENRVPVGVIYGPSGSGKSSFVKAGLMPQVKDQVQAIYVESTQSDTEVRLIKALRERFPAIPHDLGLPEIFVGLAVSRWQKTPQKIVIFLDQFEQRLSVADDYERSQLARALRHCDGQHLQCLLLVRDDFWLALTRFADALEMDLLEGQNSQDIDLFDRPHAKKVLIKLGRAYGRLPEGVLSEPQDRFLDEVVDQLAVGNHVICVRLTLFAEMFKSRDWTLAELKSVGGIHGVGEKFLEETFGSASGPRRFQLQRESVQNVLESLLPESGSDIRGAMKSEADLLVASRLQQQPKQFRRLIKTLDGELRLITRTDPDASGESKSENRIAKEGQAFYQLTHDYLVPSIRDWLTTELRKSRSGRAKLRLRELASQINPGQPPKYLPTHFEWLSWQFFLLGNSQMTDKEQLVMRAGRKRFLSSFALFASIFVFLAVLISLAFVQSSRKATANNLVNLLMGQLFDQTPQIVSQLSEYSDLVLPQLKQIEVDNRNNPTCDAYRRVLLGLVQFEPHYRPELIENMTRGDCSPEELLASIKILTEFGKQKEKSNLALRLEEILSEDANDVGKRFRAAVSLTQLGKTNTEWSHQAAGLIGSALIREPVTTHAAWIKSLKPIGILLVSKFCQMFTESDQRDRALALAMAMYEFTEMDQRAHDFSNLVINSNDAQFDAILSVFEGNQKQNELREQILARDRQVDDEKMLATRAIALLRLGRKNEFVKILKNAENPGIRSHAIILCNSNRIDFVTLRNLFESNDCKENLFRQGLLMAFAERVPTTYDDLQGKWLDERAEYHCLKDEHPGCFAAAELIAKRRGTDFKKYRESRKGILGCVFVNSQLQAFSIIKPNDENRLESPIAVSLTEVVNIEFNKFIDDKETDFDPLDEGINRSSPNTPYIIKNFSTIFEYCNWLTEKDNIEKSEWVFPKERIINFNQVQKTRYRLMTHQEWLVICDSQKNGTRYLGKENQLADNYAWTYENSGGNSKDVGLLLPNESGLFDLFGNVHEVCAQEIDSKINFFVVGNFARQNRRLLSTQYKFTLNSSHPQQDMLPGLRIVRTIPYAD